MLGQVLYTTGFIYHSVILWMKHCHDYHGSSISALLRVIDLLLSHLPHHHQILCIMMVPTTASQNHPQRNSCQPNMNICKLLTCTDDIKHLTTILLDSTYPKQSDEKEMTSSVFQIITDAILSYCRLYISKKQTFRNEHQFWVSSACWVYGIGDCWRQVGIIKSR